MAQNNDKSANYPKIDSGTNLNKNAAPPSESNGEPSSDNTTAKRTKIEEVEQFLKSKYNLRYNVVKNEIEYQEKGKTTWNDCDERAALRMEAELLKAGHSGIGRVLVVCLANVEEFDPLEHYLKSLPQWDGRDYIADLCRYVIMPEKRREWFTLMFKKHLVRLVQCASGRLSFNKQILTLVSSQGEGKTSFFRFVCPPPLRDYFTEDIDFESKDGLIALSRNVFIVLDELRGMSRADVNKIKSTTSKDKIKARLPFDRRETLLRRRATFFASTNDDSFLTDETGNVRWLVFEIEGIQHDHGGPNGYQANINIDLVYAQAWALANDPNFNAQLTREEIEKSEQRNQSHTKKTAEYEAILTHFRAATDDDKNPEFLTASAIKKRLESEPYFYKISSVEAIGKALRQMNVPRVKKRLGTQALFGYMLLPREAGALESADSADED